MKVATASLIIRLLAITVGLLTLIPAASRADSCAAEIGIKRAKVLAARCIEISPATHPPCNIGNSCALVRQEIIRSCKYDQGRTRAYKRICNVELYRNQVKNLFSSTHYATVLKGNANFSVDSALNFSISIACFTRTTQRRSPCVATGHFDDNGDLIIDGPGQKQTVLSVFMFK
jgi:hypothetical protein